MHLSRPKCFHIVCPSVAMYRVYVAQQIASNHNRDSHRQYQD